MKDSKESRFDIGNFTGVGTAELLSYPQTAFSPLGEIFRFVSLKQLPGRIIAGNMRQAVSLLLLKVVFFSHQGTAGELSDTIRELPQQQLQ